MLFEGHAPLHIAYAHFWPRLGVQDALRNLFDSPEQRVLAHKAQQMQDEAGLHVKRVLDWSAVPSWSEKQQKLWHVTNCLGTGFDLAVHLLILWAHVSCVNEAMPKISSVVTLEGCGNL